jgi:HK97 family phage prohead protease
MERKEYHGTAEIKDPAQGLIQAVFSTFNIKDADGDVVKPGAIPDGTEVVMVWGHDWQSLPVGKGVIRADKKRAIFDGQFNLATQAGRDAFETIKFNGKTQQYSWGFEILDAEYGDFTDGDGKQHQVRFIKNTRPFEVSPVVVGSNPRTETLAVKDSTCPTCKQPVADSAEGTRAGERLNTDTPAGEEPSPVTAVGDDWKAIAQLELAKARIGTECS